MEGMGPNGVLFASTFTDSKRRRDIKITVACGFGELIVVPGGESYGKQFSGEIDATQAFLEIVQDVVRAAQSLRLPTDTKERDEAQVPPGQNPMQQSTSTAATAKSTSTIASKPTSFHWTIGAVLLWCLDGKDNECPAVVKP
jgi:hypothetical protein